MKQSKLPPVALKAVLTDENKGWTILELHEELLKEQKTGGEEAEEAAEDKEIKVAYEKDKDWEI